MTIFSKRILQSRTAMGLTRQELGATLNLTDQAVYAWEKETSTPTLSTFIKLCDVFDTSADYLLGRDERTMHIEEFDSATLDFLKEFQKLDSEKQYALIRIAMILKGMRTNAIISLLHSEMESRSDEVRDNLVHSQL